MESLSTGAFGVNVRGSLYKVNIGDVPTKRSGVFISLMVPFGLSAHSNQPSAGRLRIAD